MRKGGINMNIKYLNPYIVKYPGYALITFIIITSMNPIIDYLRFFKRYKNSSIKNNLEFIYYTILTVLSLSMNIFLISIIIIIIRLF